MGVGAKTTETVDVVLLRLGEGKEEYELAVGSTLADLLRMVHASADDQDVLIDGRPLPESIPLRTGMVVSMVPRALNAGQSASWREAMADPAIRQAFEEMMEAVEQNRAKEKELS